ncbi:8852_t:CDS:1, partial [Racocetra persica]
NQASYLGIPKDELLFFLANRQIHLKPIANILILRKRLTELKMTDLIDLEEVKDNKDSDMEIEEFYKNQKNQESQDSVVQD